MGLDLRRWSSSIEDSLEEQIIGCESYEME